MCSPLVKSITKEKGINVEEAKKVYEERKNFRKYFKEVKSNGKCKQ